MTAPESVTSSLFDLLRSTEPLVLLAFGAALGVPIAALVHGFLLLVDATQGWIFSDLPLQLRFAEVRAIWPLPVLAVGVLVVADVASVQMDPTAPELAAAPGPDGGSAGG